MFRDDTQAFRAIRLLLARLGLDGLWTDAGPSKGALLLRDEHDVPLSPEKRTLLLAAWSLWSPVAAGVATGDVLHRLDRGSCLALCSLIVAYTSGADAVDAWIDAASVPASMPAAPAAPPAPPAIEPPPAVAAIEAAPPPARALFADWPTLDVLSVRYVDRVLVHVHDNKSEAARVLGVDRRTVSRLVTAAHEARRRSTPR
jgi:hypothetical protein